MSVDADLLQELERISFIVAPNLGRVTGPESWIANVTYPFHWAIYLKFGNEPVPRIVFSIYARSQLMDETKDIEVRQHMVEHFIFHILGDHVPGVALLAYKAADIIQTGQSGVRMYRNLALDSCCQHLNLVENRRVNTIG